MFHLHDVEKLRLIPLCTHWGLTHYLYSLKGLFLHSPGQSEAAPWVFYWCFLQTSCKDKSSPNKQNITTFALAGRILVNFHKTQGVASLAIGLCTHWAFSPFLTDTNI